MLDCLLTGVKSGHNRLATEAEPVSADVAFSREQANPLREFRLSDVGLLVL
jgi:hypothetical protein